MLKFLRTTLVGGIMFLLPLGVIVVIGAKLVSLTREMIEPIVQKFPYDAFAGVKFEVLVAIAVLVVVSFIAGFAAKTRRAQSFVQKLEDKVLGRVPAYGLLKSLSAEILDAEGQAQRRVVLVRFDDTWQIGVEMGKTGEGAFSVVFLPDSPTPQAGTVIIVESDRVRDSDIPLSKAYSILAARGGGLAELLSVKSLAGERATGV